MRDVLIKELDSAVFESCRHSLALFMKTYLPEHCSRKLEYFHLEIIRALEEATFKRNMKIALVSPRGYGKSTIVSLAYPLWCLAYGHEAYIVILSSTQVRARDIFDNIRAEVAGNELLRRAVPHLFDQPAKWKNGYAMTAGGIKVIATSVDSEIRGLRNRESRPSLVINDDIETSKNTYSLESRQKFHKKFAKEVLKLGDTKTNVILCGTMLSQDSLQGKIHKKKDFHGWITIRHKSVIEFSTRVDLWEQWSLIYRGLGNFNGFSGWDAARMFFESRKAAMLQGTRVLWEAYEDYYTLIVQKEEIGDIAFYSEKQNDPKEGGNLYFDSKGIVRWDDEGIVESGLFHKHAVLIGAADFGYSQKASADYSVISTVLLDTKTNIIYVLDSVGDQWPYDILVKQVVDMHRKRKYARFVVEANGAQVWFKEADELKRNHIEVQEIVHTETKHNRLMSLFLSIQNGSVKLSKHHIALWEQLTSYPHCAHDDYIDSLAMAVSAAKGYSRASVSMEDRLEVLQGFTYNVSYPSALETALASSGSYLEARLVDAMIRANT
ncbi:MAG: hypothetical protein HQL20_11420 [Candidatus Omnitrophica bacterium]|nr:hypothetical protein [Candidatus Omnitrophota bacterium]